MSVQVSVLNQSLQHLISLISFPYSMKAEHIREIRWCCAMLEHIFADTVTLDRSSS